MKKLILLRIMLNRKKQVAFIHKRCDNIVHHINNFCTRQEGEDLHKLRVEIKKLRAYTAFASKLLKQNLKKDLDPVVEVFRKAGEIRSIQLDIKTIRKHRMDEDGFKKDHSGECEDLSRQFISSSDNYIQQIRHACNKLTQQCASIGNKAIRKFYKKQLNNLSLFFSRNFDEKKLHSRRKLIKTLLYVENMLSKKLKSQLALNVSYLDTLQDICGEWHDMMLAIDLIKRNDQRKDSEMHLVKELEGLLHAVKTLGEYFDRNISVKKIMVVGS